MIYEFTPTQDLHGYNEPWAPGAGTNILPPVLNGAAESITSYGLTITIVDQMLNIKGTASASGGRLQLRTAPFTLPAGDYYLDAPFSAAAKKPVPFIQKQSDNSIIKNDAGAFTLEEETEIFLGLNVTGGDVYDNDKYGVQLTASSAATTTFYPYSNICPISGYNIWDPSQDKMIQVYSGYVDANANKLYLHPVYEEYDGEELVGPWMSSLDKYTEEGTPTTDAFVVDFGGDVSEYDITDFMLQTLLDSLGVRRFITSGAMLLNSLMDQAQGRVRSEEELLNRSLPLHVIAIGEDLPTNLVIKKPISDVLPGLPGKIKI